jgi:hypothetical protein
MFFLVFPTVDSRQLFIRLVSSQRDGVTEQAKPVIGKLSIFCRFFINTGSQEVPFGVTLAQAQCPPPVAIATTLSASE